MKRIQLIGAILIAAALCFTACKPKDADIKTNVSAAVENDKVDIDVKDGVVTLSGEVKTAAAKAKAEADAHKVAGVQTVNNDITIAAPPPLPDKEDEGDEKLNREVQAVIVPFPDVRASVNNGVVTLTGKVNRPGLVLLMPKIAGLFPKKIENNLEIK